MAFILDAGTTIACPHGGKVTVVPTVTRATLGGLPPLLENDLATVAGCGLTSPCVKVQWKGAATKVRIQGGAPLLSTSQGICIGSGPQGTALVTGFQTRVQAK
jgi:hypothetical protein